METTVERIASTLGAPRNYGPTPAELQEIRRAQEESRLKREAEERTERERREAEEAAERKRNQEEWVRCSFGCFCFLRVLSRFDVEAEFCFLSPSL